MPVNLRQQLPAYEPFDKPVDPPTSDPDEGTLYTVCFNEEYLPYILGALGVLARPETYKGDDLAAINQAAQRGSHLLDIFMGECPVPPTKLRADDACTLSWSYDDWATFDSYDPSACILANIDSTVPGMITQAIIDAINSGQLQGGTGQQGPQSPPAPGSCQTYHVRLTPGAKWHCPSPVSTGDTIHITNATGGWSIGELSWYCPDGSRYLLGICDGTLKTHVSGDPLNPGAYHMALIGLLGSVYFDPQTSIYTVPGGTPSTDFYVLANTNLTSQPSGEVEFDLEVCSSVLWCHLFDFTISNGAWYASPSNHAAWTAGVGWGNLNGYTQIQRDLGGTYTIVEVAVWSVQNIDNNRAAIRMNDLNGAIYNVLQNNYTMDGALFKRVWSVPNIAGTGLWFAGDASSVGVTVPKIMIRGRGTNPFGSSNC